MRYVELPYAARAHELPFYLAMEEYLAKGVLADGSRIESDCLFFWQVEPTVIFGRHQDVASEIDLEYCHRHNIRFYRRKSGGGCVYADRDNVMLSYVTTRRDTVADIFSRYTTRIADALCSLGIDARATGRNDIEVDGMKVSGAAFYHTPAASIVHSTMLYNTDMSHMVRAITPAHSKLASKGVQSVESRITTLNRYISLSLPDFMAYLKQALCDEPPVHLSDADVEEIRRMSLAYYDSEWIYGRRSTRHSIERERHIDSAGNFMLRLSEDTCGHITCITLSGDFFPLADIDEHLLCLLQGVELTRPALENALRGIDSSTIIRGLPTSEFINLIIS